MKRLINSIFQHRKLLISTIIVLGILFLFRNRLSTRKTPLDQTEIKRGDVVQELVLSGEIKAGNHAKLSFATSGKISWIGIKEGERVTQGQALAKLDTISLNADLQRAKADLRSAEATVDKIHDDIKNHSTDESFSTRETRTVAEVAKDKAWEALIKAQDNLKNATLITPFPGLVTFVANPFPGVNVLSTQTQIEIVQPETIYFSVTADQSEVTSIFEDQEVTIVLDSFQDRQFQGQIDYISYTPNVGEIGTVYEIKVKVPQQDIDTRKVRVGMTGDAKIITNRVSNVLYVPPKFINRKNGDKYLLVGSPTNQVIIQTSAESEGAIEIKSGPVKEGDVVYH